MTRNSAIDSIRPFALFVTGIAGVLTLAGCSLSGPADGQLGTGGSGSGTETVEQPDVVTGDCLVGSWFIAEDQLQSFYDAMDTPTEFDIDGGTGLSFTADSYEYTPEFTLNMTVAGHEVAGTLVGSITGQYTSDGAKITTSHDTSDVSMTISLMGTTQDAGEAFNDFMGVSPINSAPYTCEAGAPVIMFATGEGNPRVPVRLSASD